MNIEKPVKSIRDREKEDCERKWEKVMGSIDRYRKGNDHEEVPMLLDAFKTQAFMNEKILLNLRTRVIACCLRQVLTERIIVDGLYYALIIRGDRLSIHENIKHTIAKLSEAENVYFFVVVFSDSQIKYLHEKSLKLPITVADIPLSPERQNATSVFDAHTVVVNFVKKSEVSGIPFHREVSLVDNLLKSVGKIRENGKMYNVLARGGATTKILERSTSPWAMASHGLEMLKKTALRQATKYYCMERGQQ